MKDEPVTYRDLLSEPPPALEATSLAARLGVWASRAATFVIEFRLYLASFTLLPIAVGLTSGFIVAVDPTARDYDPVMMGALFGTGTFTVVLVIWILSKVIK